MSNLAQALRIFFWSYVFIYAVIAALTITQVDVWWQLEEGAHILRTWTLPTQPAVAFGLPAAPYFDEYAGYEVVLALIYKAGGFVGVWLFFIAIYLAILFLPQATTARKYPSFDIPSTLALLAVVLLTQPRLGQRPELVGVLFQVLLMALLRASSLQQVTPRLVAGLFVLFLAWTHVHSTFVIGFFTLGLWLAHEGWVRSGSVPLAVLLRRGALLAAAAVLATMLNPYGPRRLLFPFLQASDPGSTAISPEMWPIADYPPLVSGVALFALALLIWGIATTRVPLWIIAFSGVAAILSLRSIRFTDFAAVALLFVYAGREVRGTVRSGTLARVLAAARNILLCLLIPFFLLMDVFSLAGNVKELGAELRFATHGLRYASDMAAYPVIETENRSPVLCGLGTGSYVSFPGNGYYRPLLDSGLSHFSDDTKRYFFFVWSEPQALELALRQLHVDYVLIDPDTFAWIPTLHRQPDWQFVACSVNGMLWKRSNGGPQALGANDRAQVIACANDFFDHKNYVAAFVYSTLLNQPADSLALLARDPGASWRETFFNSLQAWIDDLPESDVQSFLNSHKSPSPLLGAMLAARLGPEAYDRFRATGAGDPGVWYWKAIAVEVELRKGDLNQARAILASIPSVPASTSTYYRLWREVHAGDKSAAPLSAYGQWQTWDESTAAFMGTFSARLNDRLAELDRAPSR
jgi:hypothetical protein